MDFNVVKIFLVSLFLIATALAEDSCKGYSDVFDVRILDANLNRVSDGTVWIKYDPGIPATPYFQTPPKALDNDGKVHFDIFNQANELTIRNIDCNILIHVEAGNSSKELTVRAAKHSAILDVQVPDIYPLDFYVRDEANIPLQNASVYVGGVTKKTDKSGHTTFYFKNGEYNFLASFMQGKQDGFVTISGGTQYEVKFKSSPLKIFVYDDQGNPLVSNITVFGKTNSSSSIEFERVYGTLFDYSVDYKGLIKSGIIDTTKIDNAIISYDINPPLISGTDAQVTNGQMRLTMKVSDNGKYASGVDTKSFHLIYKVEPSDPDTPFSSAQVYSLGSNSYYADFPNLPPNRIVQFKLDVKDKEGNKALIDGRFVTSSTLSVNDTDPPNPNPNADNSILLYGVGVLVIVGAAVYVLMRMRKKPS